MRKLLVIPAALLAAVLGSGAALAEGPGPDGDYAQLSDAQKAQWATLQAQRQAKMAQWQAQHPARGD
jgi:hypothetical protein